jgi:formylglycine-generating enzyme required for sulfatase activity
MMPTMAETETETMTLDLVHIPGGSHLVGEGREAQKVDLAPFHIARFPVTNAEWQVYMESGGGPTPAYWDDPRYNDPAQPVVGVSWYEATAYCAWLSDQTGMDVRLPTEGEWEAAARGGDMTFSNVYELTSSLWDSTNDGPNAPRVVRGGSWSSDSGAAFRYYVNPHDRYPFDGFRVAVDDAYGILEKPYPFQVAAGGPGIGEG